jgi:hypothetical protein
VLPSYDSPGVVLVWLGVVETSLIAHVERFHDLCVALSFNQIFKTTTRLKQGGFSGPMYYGGPEQEQEHWDPGLTALLMSWLSFPFSLLYFLHFI